MEDGECYITGSSLIRTSPQNAITDPRYLSYSDQITGSKPSALRSNQPLKITTRDFSWGKGGRGVRLTTYHPYSAESRDDPGS